MTDSNALPSSSLINLNGFGASYNNVPLSNDLTLTSIVVSYGATLHLGGYIVTANSVFIVDGTIDLGSGAIIVNTADFAFVPQGGQNNEYMVNGPGQVESGDAAIHDALAEGANYAGITGPNAFWDGTNGILSSTAANNPNATTAVGWIDNSIQAYTVFRGAPVGVNQSIIAYAYYGDADLSSVVDNVDFTVWKDSQSQSAGMYGGGFEWADGDFDQSGTVLHFLNCL